MPRASAELLWPTSSYVVSPAALTPSPGGAVARGIEGVRLPSLLRHYQADKEKGGREDTGSRRIWWRQHLFWAGHRVETSDSKNIPVGATSLWNCSMACLGFPWISSAPEQHLSWQVHLRPPSPRSRCESGGQNSLVPQSWSGRSASSSSSAGVSLPHSSPVCAKIHSCSLTVPVSLRCRRPQGALARPLLTPCRCHSHLGSLGKAGPEQGESWEPSLGSQGQGLRP